MPLCARCGQALEDGAAVCPNCGTPKAPTPKYRTGSRSGDQTLGGGIGCLAAVLLVSLDIFSVAPNGAPGTTGLGSAFAALQVVVLAGMIALSVLVLRRGPSVAMRAGWLTFIIIFACTLGLYTACVATWV